MRSKPLLQAPYRRVCRSGARLGRSTRFSRRRDHLRRGLAVGAQPPYFEATAVATLSPTTWVAGRRISRKSSKPSGGPKALGWSRRASLGVLGCRARRPPECEARPSKGVRKPAGTRSPARESPTQGSVASLACRHPRRRRASSGAEQREGAKLAAAASHCPGSSGTLAPPTLHHPAYAPPVF